MLHQSGKSYTFPRPLRQNHKPNPTYGRHKSSQAKRIFYSPVVVVVNIFFLILGGENYFYGGVLS